MGAAALGTACSGAARPLASPLGACSAFASNAGSDMAPAYESPWTDRWVWAPAACKPAQRATELAQVGLRPRRRGLGAWIHGGRLGALMAPMKDPLDLRDVADARARRTPRRRVALEAAWSGDRAAPSSRSGRAARPDPLTANALEVHEGHPDQGAGD